MVYTTHLVVKLAGYYWFTGTIVFCACAASAVNNHQTNNKSNFARSFCLFKCFLMTTWMNVRLSLLCSCMIKCTPPICLPISIYIYLYLSISIYIYLYLSISIYVYLYYIYLYPYPSISIYLSIYLSLSLSLYIYLSICLNIWIVLLIQMPEYLDTNQ